MKIVPLTRCRAEEPLLSIFTIEVSNNDTFEIVKGSLRYFKRHAMICLIEKAFFLIPFKARCWHFMLPFNYMGPDTTKVLTRDWVDW